MASIRKRGENSYQITVCTGYDSEGKKLTKQQTIKRPADITDFQWEKELNRLATLFEDQVLKGEYYTPSHYTVAEFIDKWLLEHGKNLESKTYYRYEGMLKGRVKTVMGHIQLEKLKPMHLFRFLQEPPRARYTRRHTFHCKAFI